MSYAPGNVRDAIVGYLAARGSEATTKEIHDALVRNLGAVASSSVRSYLNLNTPEIFERTGRGRYRLKLNGQETESFSRFASIRSANATLYHADCFDWLAQQEPASVQAVVTDPPYGLVEYTGKEQEKLRSGKGGVWRIPPSFDGHVRSPLPRFTVLTDNDRLELQAFFCRLGYLLGRVLVPGANILIASNPLVGHIVASAMVEAGLEARGTIIRTVMTMRGGDRPKNAHLEFPDVSVMPRSMWEPWLVFRKQLDGRVQDNLRRWGTGGFRRPSADKPFGDVIKSSPTSAGERRIAAHPSLKPQAFLRQVVRASLPLGEGVILDPFAGSGSTLAAANAVGYESVGVESDVKYFELAKTAIEKLTSLAVQQIDPVGA
ncbi:MAG: DNA methylase [Alphaproteobacteria bacterium HGW-Alphaproteobacteria-12]|nr:MAG: DNA methylase [Alphaproteobacteria bacterium HGW-Alphaproteobacteria-12]